MSEEPERLGSVIHSEHPDALVAVVLELSQLRACFAVGRELWRNYPVESQWLAACNSQGFLELVDEFAQAVQDIRDTVQFGPVLSPESVQEAVAQHYQRALDGVSDFAEAHGMDGENLLAVLVNAAGRLARERDELDDLRAQVVALTRRVEELGGGSARGT